MSMRTILGFLAFAISTASAPFPASTTSYSRQRILLTNCLTTGSSSTTSTRLFTLSIESPRFYSVHHLLWNRECLSPPLRAAKLLRTRWLPRDQTELPCISLSRLWLPEWAWPGGRASRKSSRQKRRPPLVSLPTEESQYQPPSD